MLNVTDKHITIFLTLTLKTEKGTTSWPATDGES